MKSLSMLIVAAIMHLTAFTQYNTVTINYNGNNRQLSVDGKIYTPTANINANDNADVNARGNTVVITDLAPGSHRLEIIRNNNRNNVSTNFTLRNNYDLDIRVQGNGSVQLKETYRKRNVNTPMSVANFNALTRQVTSKRLTAEKIVLVSNAFTNTSNFFTSNQVKRLLQLISGEANRLSLAKVSYRSVTDPQNFTTLNTLFSTNARRELAAYVADYSNQVPGNSYKVPMTDAAFTTLFNDIRNRWQPGAKFSGVSTAFNTANTYFTTSQAIQLVQLVTSESERLQLAKASYRTITDPANFIRMYDLLANQSSKEELAYFIRTNGGTGTTVPSVNTAMNTTAFNVLMDDIRGRWLPGAKKTAVLEVFANTNNYFTVNQVVQLVQTDSDEPDRLEMAKASIRSIVDPANIVVLYNVFTTPSRRNELIEYVRRYNAGETGSGNTGTYKTPITNTDFTALYNETKSLWLPGAKKSAILTAFSRPDTYFTVQQARQLIMLDNDEDDRLDMAKASYRVLTDPQNVSQMYDLFSSQSFLTDFTNFVRNNPL